MQRIALILISLWLAGCTAAGQTAKKLTDVRSISRGMSKQEVAAILGTQVIVGYELADAKTGIFKPITLPNPHRIQTITKNNRTYDIAFYLTEVRQADELVSDDELTPFVFEQDKVVGQGWPFVNKILREK